MSFAALVAGEVMVDKYLHVKGEAGVCLLGFPTLIIGVVVFLSLAVVYCQMG
jgi:hypothetical protein